MRDIVYAYLDAEGYVRQWSKAAVPSAVECLTLHQLLPGESMREFQRMIDGALVSYEPEVSLDDVKAGAIADANAARDRCRAAFDRFIYDGVMYDGHVRAEVSIALAARRAEQGGASSVLWRAFDNSDWMLSPAQVIALEAALIEAKANWEAQAHETCRALKAKILSAATLAEVRAAATAALSPWAIEGKA